MRAVRDIGTSCAWYARVLGCGVECPAADFARLEDDARELMLRDPDGFRIAVTGR